MRLRLLPLVLLLSLVVKAEVSVTALSQEELANAVYTIGKVVLHNDTLCLVAADGSVLGCEPVSNVRSLVFIDGMATALDEVEEPAVSVYPNPTQDLLQINGANGTTVRVFDLNGRCLLTTQEQLVNVQTLPMGSYLLQVNTKVVKFIKN